MKKSKVFIIAEAGVNHNGSLRLAKKLVDAAKHCGADAVKFQAFSAEEIAVHSAPKAQYQKSHTKKNQTQLQMLKKLEFGYGEHKELAEYCKKKKIIFISSPFDLNSIDLLRKLNLRIIKIPSGEITNIPYLRKIGALSRKIILSTGMADLSEISQALKILVSSGTKKSDITVLHCHTAYPTADSDVNLRAMLTIRDVYGVNVGYSDHTSGIDISLAAAALGAKVVEKHITLNKKMSGPDHKASIEPDEFRRMVEGIRRIEKAFGSKIKKPSGIELRNRVAVRKSIVAARDIMKDELFLAENITVKRPAGGIGPERWDEVIGKNAKKDFRKNEMIRL